VAATARAVVYVRVSTDDQAEHGVSIKAQEQACRDFAAGKGWTVADVLGDPGVSGSTPVNARPGLRAAIDLLAPGDVLLAYNRSRLFRAAPIVIAMIEAEVAARGASIRTVSIEGTGSDSAADVFVRRIMDAQGEHWINAVREGTQRALDHKRAHGEALGNIPYGWRLAPDGLHLEPDPADAGLVETVRRLRDAGLAYRRIAEVLPHLGYRPKKGAAEWSHTSVRRLLGKVKRWRQAKRARELAEALKPKEPAPCPTRPSRTSSARPSTTIPAASRPSPPPPTSPSPPSAASSSGNAA